MINNNFLKKLNPSIVLKVIKSKDIYNEENIEDINKMQLECLLKTKRYQEIDDFISNNDMDLKIKKLIKEQVWIANKNYLKTMNDSIIEFYEESKNKKKELIENNYSKNYMMEMRIFDKIANNKHFFEKSMDLVMYLFNTNELDECLNLLKILENVNKYNKNHYLNIYWGLFYINFLQGNYKLAKEILKDKIFLEINKNNYNINMYVSFVKYYYINEYYINSGEFDKFWITLFNCKGFSKAIELDQELLLPHVILIFFNEFENFDKIINLKKVWKFSNSNNVIYELIDMLFIDLNINYNILHKINIFLSESIFYNKNKNNILQSIKNYVLSLLSKLLKQESTSNLMKLFLFENSNDFEKWIINQSILKNLNITINLEENLIEFNQALKVDSNKEVKIYNKMFDLLKKYKIQCN